MQTLFQWDFNHKPKASIKDLLRKQKEIDEKISKAAPQWQIEKINKIDLAILRLAVFELLLKKEPIKVIIDEAVELAKEYGSENSSSFVNGVLGKLINDN
ncbi:MAG: N utilization substance protein B [Microgenomates group bacterium Gr01-1014_93]|nr:MAG: N utilization substance protein B [Microgenomates group bacterium Gr01-1014_93]